ncbi:response regulator [Mucilaginibacter endophyticus]|uniref:response regulator n=1 Tax=Mucilaginibacter endophyticus TaxID=2675003 RepID=UPI000E0DCE26|nr:response regulator [Mucilaginibacter endophyticus]
MPKRVVVVDDDNDILQIIKYVLEEQKISVKAVNDVVSFQGIINGQPELILLDDWLSDGRSGELCKKSRPVRVP